MDFLFPLSIGKRAHPRRQQEGTWGLVDREAASAAAAAASESNPAPRSPAAILKSGETTPKVGFGLNAGYGFPGFSFGLPDAGMVGGE